MTDSVAIFPPGFRVLDENGDPVSGAQIRFFESGTTTPKEVFSDSSLLTSLGAIVYTRSDGYPVAAEDSNTTVAVFTGSDPYKVDILDADDVTIWPAKDNQRGAVDTSDFLTSSDTTTIVLPATALAVDTTLTASHNGKLIVASGSITLTLTDPATLGNDWNVRIRCNDATNAIKLVAAAGTIKGSGFSIAAIALSGLGSAVEIVCDGGNFHIIGRVGGGAASNGRVFSITSRVSSAPATTPGNLYLVSTAFSTFSIGDIIEATGQATFIGYTPPSNCGWLAYVESENALYEFVGSIWVIPGMWGQCQLTKSGSSLLLSPYNGNRLTVNGGGVLIPDGGVSLLIGALSAATFYYIYAYMSSGALTLEASATAPAVQAGTGLKIKSGDATRTLVGAAYTDSGPAWADTDGKRWVLSWFNRRWKKSRTVFSTDRATTSTSYAELNSEIRNQFISWFEEEIRFSVMASILATGDHNACTSVGFDGTTAEAEEITQSIVNAVLAGMGLAASKSAGVLTEAAVHYMTLLGRVNANTSTYKSSSSTTSGITAIEVWVNG